MQNDRTLWDRMSGWSRRGGLLTSHQDLADAVAPLEERVAALEREVERLRSDIERRADQSGRSLIDTDERRGTPAPQGRTDA